ncbi:hypothetical protein GYMLUDRAFT_431519 [Collybiopsis luxurians FD-317 M1]|uniref:Uncharacterized protein n=1 Tax=Collybiopsis luxurians FD-317 M1 TaxID=944289 RepID=A0A0D0CWC4_9AGAR|nr:hypothetical protein GYMLUDRAFT_431519 [Collybiopsis luxurians FD-317 M1]
MARVLAPHFLLVTKLQSQGDLRRQHECSKQLHTLCLQDFIMVARIQISQGRPKERIPSAMLSNHDTYGDFTDNIFKRMRHEAQKSLLLGENAFYLIR